MRGRRRVWRRRRSLRGRVGGQRPAAVRRDAKASEGIGREQKGLEGSRRSKKESEGVGRSRKKSEEVGRSQKESEGVRRSQKESEGVRKSQKESEGVGRSQKESEGVRRSRKEEWARFTRSRTAASARLRSSSSKVAGAGSKASTCRMHALGTARWAAGGGVAVEGEPLLERACERAHLRQRRVACHP